MSVSPGSALRLKRRQQGKAPFRRFVLLVLLLYAAAPNGLSGQQSSKDLSSAAKRSLDAGQYAEAEKIYRKLLQSSPASPVLLTNLGITLDLQERPAEAAEYFKKSLRVRNDPRTYALLTKEQCDQKDFADASPMLDRIVRESSARPDLLSIIAPCLLPSGHAIAAVSVYRSLASDPAFVSDRMLVDLTRAYLAAAKVFSKLLNEEPGHESYVQAIQSARSNEAGGARSAFPLAASRSELFRAEATYPEAVAAWEKRPHDSALLYQLCVLSGEGSLDTLNRLRTSYPSSHYAGQFVAEILVDQGNREEAKTQYEELMKIDPELPGLRDDFGTLLIQQQDWEAALAVFTDQLKHHPSDRQAAARVSQALVELGRFEDLKAFLLPKAASPNVPLWLRLDLATAFQQLGDKPKAIEQLVAAEKSFPSEKSVHYRLLRLYALTGDTTGSAREKVLFESLK